MKNEEHVRVHPAQQIVRSSTTADAPTADEMMDTGVGRYVKYKGKSSVNPRSVDNATKIRSETGDGSPSEAPSHPMETTEPLPPTTSHAATSADMNEPAARSRQTDAEPPADAEPRRATTRLQLAGRPTQASVDRQPDGDNRREVIHRHLIEEPPQAAVPTRANEEQPLAEPPRQSKVNRVRPAFAVIPVKAGNRNSKPRKLHIPNTYSNN